MAITPRSTVQPPPRLAPTLTLIGASRTVLGDQSLDGGPVRWEGHGVTFRPLPCDPDFVPFVPGCGQFTLDLDAGRQGAAAGDSLVLWAGVACANSPSELTEGDARARQLLDVDRHRQLEYEFWTGTALQAALDPTEEGEIRWLAQDGVATELETGTATPLTEALTRLQQALADCGGGRGMIHATVRTAALWAGLGLLRREGGVLLDIFDNLVVPGVGYPGSAPDGTVDATGDTAWAYATGIVETRLGPVEVNGGVDPTVNDVHVVAQQPGMAYWDGCCHVGINVDHAATGLTGAAS